MMFRASFVSPLAKLLVTEREHGSMLISRTEIGIHHSAIASVLFATRLIILYAVVHSRNLGQAAQNIGPFS